MPCMIVLAYLGLGLTGCSSFGKKNNAGDRPPSVPSTDGRAPAKFPANEDPLFKTSAVSPVTAPRETIRSDTILAGTIIDAYNQKPPEAYVSYVCVEDGKPVGAPIDVAADSRGGFTILGLKPNKAYKLIARAKQGDKLIAGVTYAKPPNALVLIRLSENLANEEIPPIPDAPAYKPRKDDPKKATLLPPETSHAPTWQPTNAAIAAGGTLQSGGLSIGLGAPRPLVSPELPARVNLPPAVPPPPPPDGGWVPGIADKGKNWPPMLEIRKPTPANVPSSPPAIPETPPIATPKVNTSAAPFRLPSCTLVGYKLDSFALNDTAGRPFDFKTQRKGRLVLLDFWATWCVPCQKSMPHLAALQAKYGPALEIIGIACESDGTAQQQAAAVNAVCQRLQVSHRQLLGAGARCPVQHQFGVRVLPTLVLLDETGQIIWRHESFDTNAREDLELLIQRKLGLR